MERVRITKRTVDAAPLPASGESRIWDSDVKGFCLRVYATGRKVYAIKYRVDGRQRWFTIGEHGSPWTPEQARDRAAAILREAASGEDAQTEKLSRRRDLDVSALIERYLSEGPATRPLKRASAWATDAIMLRRHVAPLLGRKIARQVSRSDVARMATFIIEGRTATTERSGKARSRTIVKGGPGASERALTSLGAMYAWAQENEIVSDNPARQVKLPKRKAKERFLSPIEIARLRSTLDDMETRREINTGHADVLRLLLLTGARKSEIMGLRWDEVDFDRRRLVLPPERSKAGARTGERRIALNEPALAILRRRPVATSPFVFPAERGGAGHTVGLQRTWSKVRRRAALEDVRVHDLRHTFASVAIANGAGLAVIGKALGHSTARVTERYAHLTDAAVHQLSQLVGESVEGAS